MTGVQTCALPISTTGKVLGFALEDATMVAANTTTPKKSPQWVPALPFIYMVYGASTDLAQANIGGLEDYVAVSTGAFSVNIAAATQGVSGLLFVHQRDPYGEADNDVCVVTVAQPQTLAFAAV